jgi:hypothetical protein
MIISADEKTNPASLGGCPKIQPTFTSPHICTICSTISSIGSSFVAVVCKWLRPWLFFCLHLWLERQCIYHTRIQIVFANWKLCTLRLSNETCLQTDISWCWTLNSNWLFLFANRRFLTLNLELEFCSLPWTHSRSMPFWYLSMAKFLFETLRLLWNFSLHWCEPIWYFHPYYHAFHIQIGTGRFRTVILFFILILQRPGGVQGGLTSRITTHRLFIQNC